MSHALQHLLEFLKLEKIEEGLFREQSEDLGLRQVFGGQVVGQALYAAKQTVEAGRGLHSFHSYFLLPGDSRGEDPRQDTTNDTAHAVHTEHVTRVIHAQPRFPRLA